MFCNTLSDSREGSFNRCRLQFKFNYVDKFEPFNFTDKFPMNFGKFIHRVFELGVKETTQEGLQLIADSIRKSYHVPLTEATNKKEQKCLTNFLKFNLPTLDKEHTELKYEVPLLEDGGSLNGVIDRIIFSPSSVLVIDYKTGKREASKVDLFSNNQGKGYVYAIHKLFSIPIENITFAHYYPITNNFVTIKYPKASISAYLKEREKSIWRIRKAKLSDLTPSMNDFCKNCDYYDGCPLWSPASVVAKALLEAKKRPTKSKEEWDKLNENTLRPK